MSSGIAARIAELERRMAAAVGDQDFEAAATLRDELARLRGEPTDGPRIRRQVPGRMGLGTDQPTYIPPKDWTPPKRPDPMTSGHKRRGGKR